MSKSTNWGTVQYRGKQYNLSKTPDKKELQSLLGFTPSGIWGPWQHKKLQERIAEEQAQTDKQNSRLYYNRNVYNDELIDNLNNFKINTKPSPKLTFLKTLKLPFLGKRNLLQDLEYYLTRSNKIIIKIKEGSLIKYMI